MAFGRLWMDADVKTEKYAHAYPYGSDIPTFSFPPKFAFMRFLVNPKYMVRAGLTARTATTL